MRQPIIAADGVPGLIPPPSAQGAVADRSTQAPRFGPTHRLLAAAALLALATGCQTVALVGGTRLGPWKVREKIPRATAENPAVRCVCLWQPATGVGLDNQTARGVAGQIFFFTNGSPEPVAVEGHLTIYLFDDQGSPEEQKRPIHTFEFRNDSFQPFLKSTQFGPAYELFIPYTRKGLHAAECALRVKLEQRSGPVVFSELGYVQLPGLKKKDANAPPPTSPRSPSLADARVTSTPGRTIVHDLTNGGRLSAPGAAATQERARPADAPALDARLDAATATARLQPANSGGFLKTREELEPQIRAFLEQTLRKHAAAARGPAASAADSSRDAAPPAAFGEPEHVRPLSAAPRSVAPHDVPTVAGEAAAPATPSDAEDATGDARATPSLGRFRLKPAGE